MKALLEAIQKHLGISLTEESLNHYSLLGIEPTADEETIKRALKAAAALWNASDTKSRPDDAKRVASLLKEAQATLLQPEKRRAYDKTLNLKTLNATSKENVSGRAFKSKPDSTKSDTFDDDEDLLAPFDPTRPIPQSNVMNFGNVESRWGELAQIVTFESSAVTDLLEPQIARQTLNNQTGISATLAPRTTTQSNASALVVKLRRRRKQKQLLIAGLLTLGAIGFLAFASVRFFLSRNNNLANNVPAANVVVGGNEIDNQKSVAKTPNLPPEPNKNVRSNLPTLQSNQEGDNSSNEMMSVNPGVSDQVSEPTIPSESPTTASEMMSDKSAEPASEPNESMAAMSELSAKWAASLKAARAALEKQDFGEFNKQMEIALPLYRGNNQEKMYKRLDQLGQLYEIGTKAMIEAKRKLKGTESIFVGDNQISIVEVREDVLIIRERGKNKTYPWRELPLGIVLSMTKLTLSETDPTDIAARAVYLAFEPKKNELHEKNIKELFSRCLGKGDILPDLDQALTDTYE